MHGKLEGLKMGHEKQEIVIKHNLNNNGVIMLLNLHDNLSPTWVMFLLFILDSKDEKYSNDFQLSKCYGNMFIIF